MPLYEYDCAACGLFSEMRLMSRSASPAICPVCARAAPRVLSPTAAGRGTRRRSGAARPDPVLVKREPAPPKVTPRRAHGDRPWMLGH